MSFKEHYSKLSDPLKGTFSFKILCPPKVPLEDSLLKTPINFSNAYDLANPNKMKIKVPVVEFKPVVCFGETNYLVHLKDSPQFTPSFIKLAKDKSGFEVSTDDRAMLGWYEMTTKVEASNNELVYEHDFWLEMYDSCNSTLLEVVEPIKEIKVKALAGAK